MFRTNLVPGSMYSSHSLSRNRPPYRIDVLDQDFLLMHDKTTSCTDPYADVYEENPDSKDLGRVGGSRAPCHGRVNVVDSTWN